MTEHREYEVRDATGRFMLRCDRVNDLSLKGAGNAMRWDGGIAPFRVYAREKGRGMFGLVGEVQANAFVDDNIEPDCSAVVPIELLAA